eukprot:COSAG02_NODE_5478_length_4291_cov_5.935115_4_plen_119_part_00
MGVALDFVTGLAVDARRILHRCAARALGDDGLGRWRLANAGGGAVRPVDVPSEPVRGRERSERSAHLEVEGALLAAIPARRGSVLRANRRSALSVATGMDISVVGKRCAHHPVQQQHR